MMSKNINEKMDKILLILYVISIFVLTLLKGFDNLVTIIVISTLFWGNLFVIKCYFAGKPLTLFFSESYEDSEENSFVRLVILVVAILTTIASLYLLFSGISIQFFNRIN